MKIAIDIDGTIYDTERGFRAEAEIFDIDELNGDNLIDSRALWVENRYNWTKEENEKFNKKLYEITEEASLMPGAKKVIKKLQEKGVETIIVTARGSAGFDNFEEMMQQVKDKLDADDLHFSKMFFKNLDKVETCINEKVDFIIDDSPDVCKRTSENGIHTIFLRDAGIEKIELNEYVTVAHNWGEVYRIITNALKNQQ